VEALQGVPLRACWPQKGANKLATPLVNENLAIMADLSSSSNLMALEGLPEDLCKGIYDEILPHYYQVTEQGVIMMNEVVITELRMYDIPRHRKSFANLIICLLAFVDDLRNKKNSVDLIPFNRESVSEEPAIVMSNPCNVLPNCAVVGRETSRPSLAEIVDLKSPNKSIEATSSTSINSKVVKKPSFAELLYKYQRIAEQKQNSRLGEQRWNSSSSKAKKHRRSL
jgi:hypothetical protein